MSLQLTVPGNEVAEWAEDDPVFAELLRKHPDARMVLYATPHDHLDADAVRTIQRVLVPQLPQRARGTVAAQLRLPITASFLGPMRRIRLRIPKRVGRQQHVARR